VGLHHSAKSNSNPNCLLVCLHVEVMLQLPRRRMPFIPSEPVWKSVVTAAVRFRWLDKQRLFPQTALTGWIAVQLVHVVRKWLLDAVQMEPTVRTDSPLTAQSLAHSHRQ
jgi:hypothetical protein